VPPFVIFHDATLAEMMERQPENDQQLLNISGIGESKLEKYGKAFLDVIAEHKNNAAGETSDTVSETLQLFRSGQAIETIASKRNIKTSTVYSHLASCIEQGELNLDEVIDSNHRISASSTKRF